MSDLAEKPTEALTKKIGPLPGWAYVAVIGITAYVVYYIRRNRVGVSTPVQTTVDNSGGVSQAGPMPTGGGYSGVVPTTGGAQAPSKTNAQWARDVANNMISGGSNPADVNNAIANYLAGKQLDSTQASIIATALRTYGNPPEGVVPVQQAPAAPATPLSARFVRYLRFKDDPTLYGITADGQQIGITFAQWSALGFPRYQEIDGPSGMMNRAPAISNTIYTVKDGDTLESIAQRFYGNSDTGKISSNNPGVSITPGAVLKIPTGGSQVGIA